MSITHRYGAVTVFLFLCSCVHLMFTFVSCLPSRACDPFHKYFTRTYPQQVYFSTYPMLRQHVSRTSQRVLIKVAVSMTRIQTDSTYTVCHLGVSYPAGYGAEITLLDAECTLKHSCLRSLQMHLPEPYCHTADKLSIKR